MEGNVPIPREELQENVVNPIIIRSNDPGWKYCTLAEPPKREKVKCNFCKHESTGGIYRFKKHLACRRGDVDPCPHVPDEVKREISDYLDKGAARKAKRIQQQQDARDEVDIRNRSDDEDVVLISGSKPKKAKVLGQIDQYFIRDPEDVVDERRKSKQGTISAKLKKEERKKTIQYIARWFYQAGIAFNTINLKSFLVMLEAIGQFGPDLDPPTIYELCVPLLKIEVEETKKSMENQREEWKKSGCSIMTDAWTDRRGRSIMNLCINCKKGTSFLKAIDASADRHDADFIFRLVDSCIQEVGEDKLSSGCERNWSTFEMIHTKKRNRLKVQRLNDLVFVQFNAKLKDKRERHLALKDPLESVEADKAKDWLATLNPNEDEVYPGAGVTWGMVADASGATERDITRTYTRSRRNTQSTPIVASIPTSSRVAELPEDVQSDEDVEHLEDEEIADLDTRSDDEIIEEENDDM